MKNQNAKKQVQKSPVKVPNHEADMVNKNPGQKETNITYDKNQGNRGEQMNPNQKQLKKGS